MQYRAAVAGRQHSLNVNMTARTVKGKLLSNSFHSIRSSTLPLHCYFLPSFPYEVSSPWNIPIMAGCYGAALLIILAHMNNWSFKQKKKKTQSRTMGSTWKVINQGYFPGSPPFDSRSLFAFPGPRFLACPWNEWVLWRPEVFTSNKAYYISIPKMPSPVVPSFMESRAAG